MSKRKYFKLVPFLAIILIALAVRYIFVKYNFSFSSETAGDLIDFRTSLLNGKILLLGPHSGTHPWLYFSPVYYWLFIPIVSIFGFAPEVFAYSGLFLSIGIIAVNYFVLSSLVNRKFGLISSLIIALSPFWINLTKDARFYALVPLLFYPFLVSLKKYWDGKTASLLGVFFWLTLATTFHYSALVFYFVVIVMIMIRRKNMSPKNIFEIVLGILVPFAPFFASPNRGEIIINLIAWVPYRVAGFSLIYPKNNLNLSSFLKSLEGISDFVSQHLLFSFDLNYLFLVVVFLGFIVLAYTVLRNKGKKFWETFIALSIFFSFLAAIIHGGFVPQHYFIFLAPVWVIALTFLMQKIISCRKIGIILIFLVTILIVTANGVYTFGVIKNYEEKKASLDPHFIPLGLLKNISEKIILLAEGEPFSLYRVGPFDYYQGGYLQNYEYILTLLGASPQKNQNLRFTIYEDTSLIPPNAKEVYFVENIGILKEK